MNGPPNAKGPPRGDAASPIDVAFPGGNDHQDKTRNPAATQVTNLRAVHEAKLELLREAIFENLGAVSLFAETAKLLIEARDDAGMAHSVKMGAHHYRAAVVTANELAALKDAP